MSEATKGDSWLIDRARSVVDPELGGNIVDLGMVRRIDIDDTGIVSVQVALTTARCPLRSQIEDDLTTALRSDERVRAIEITMVEMDSKSKAELMRRAREMAQARAKVPQSLKGAAVIAISSGKGGVGKSSISVNLAIELAGRGHQVGLLDADILGYSIPRMLGTSALRLEATGDKDNWRIEPKKLSQDNDGALYVVSMGLLTKSEDEAIMWRGLMVSRALQHFIEDVDWPKLDFLIIDTPPGTGDIHLSLARLLPTTEVVVVTTPSKSASKVASRIGDMARRANLHVLGVIENMANFTCAHGEIYELFGSGGADETAENLGTHVLGRISLDPEMVLAGEAGFAITSRRSEESVSGKAFSELAQTLEYLSINETQKASSCSARMLEDIEAALGPS